MKKLTLVFIIAVTSALLFACAPAPKETSIEVSCDDFTKSQHISKEMEVAVGGLFTVTLCSNPTTGFSWSELARIGDQSVLQQTDHKFIAPQAKGMMGAPGNEVWTFKAFKKGQTIISMEYGRPWEGGEKDAWTFNLTVVVK